jgi:pantetheine-phosphate adenylyltransferase
VHGLTELNVWGANTDADPQSIQSLKAAFWFHDAVYECSKEGCSNEEASVQLWLASDLAPGDPANVADLIRATDHAQLQRLHHPLSAVMRGADLAILGQAKTVYNTYTEAVRSEYAWVEEHAYRAGRRAVLQHFLAAARTGELYALPYFRDLYQGAAVRNLESEIETLSNGEPAAH